MNLCAESGTHVACEVSRHGRAFARRNILSMHARLALHGSKILLLPYDIPTRLKEQVYLYGLRSNCPKKVKCFHAEATVLTDVSSGLCVR